MIRLYEILVRFRPRIILPILTRLAFPTPHPHGLIVENIINLYILLHVLLKINQQDQIKKAMS